MHTHSLRHHVGTELFRRGANPRAVQEVLGHESLETTMRYAAVVGKDRRDAMLLLQRDTTVPVSPGDPGGDSKSASGREVWLVPGNPRGREAREAMRKVFGPRIR